VRELEGGAHRRLQPRRIGDQEDVLGDGAHQGRDRRFLKRVRPDGCARDLAANHHDRDGVRHAVADRGDGIGGARTGGHEAHAYAARGACETRGHEARALLVGRHDQRNRRTAATPLLLVVEENGIVRRQDGASAVAEDGLDALVGQHLHDHPRPGHGLAGKRMPGAETLLRRAGKRTGKRAWLDDGVAHAELSQAAAAAG